MGARVERAWRSVSAGSDGEGVQVAGEDCPSGPDSHPVIALQPSAAQPIAAFEVADSALDPCAVSRSALAGASAAGLVAAGKLDPLLGQLGRRVLRRAGHE